MPVFKRILFPVSLTKISPHVVPYVALMGGKFDAEIHLLHVVRDLNAYVDSYVSQPSETDIKKFASSFEKESLIAAKKQLTNFKNKHLQNHQSIKEAVIAGKPYKKIMEYIESENIDLVIMGSGRNIQTNLFGSVADKVAKISNTPVMLIKTV